MRCFTRTRSGQWAPEPNDVSADGIVSPLDALLIISGDGQISPLDVDGA
jgi:hypothetical protein